MPKSPPKPNKSPFRRLLLLLVRDLSFEVEMSVTGSPLIGDECGEDSVKGLVGRRRLRKDMALSILQVKKRKRTWVSPVKGKEKCNPEEYGVQFIVIDWINIVDFTCTSLFLA